MLKKLNRDTAPATKAAAAKRARDRAPYKAEIAQAIRDELCICRECTGREELFCISYGDIAFELNKVEFTSPTGKKWHRTTIERLFRNK